ncbi:AMP-binding protein [Flagellimonas sp. S3867]|uniref:AMP-binding protein n=1 Tax=Flagellimonas sp. S3867 TaxID=2768063 RepID=UPI001688F295|nr:AMP-binding protein [Flagellimonas sp. S3867]
MNLQPLTIVNPIWHSTHPDFKLNGVHYKFDELQEVGYSLVKEGEDHEIPMGEFLLDWVSDKGTLEVFTSGSTGNPKNIELKKEHMINSASATGKYFGLAAGHSALLCLPCSGIAGKMMLVRAMVLGLKLKSVEPSSTPLTGITTNFDFAAMVPLQVENSIGQLTQIRTLIIGGAPISLRLKKALKTASNAVFETYGMTETITHIAAKRLNGDKISLETDTFETLPNITLSKDSRDCLVISAPRISDHEVATNDIVDLISETTFQWLGRYDSVINSGGIKLIPEQIEKKLTSLIPSRFFVAGVPDNSLGQKLVLLIESDNIFAEKLLERIKGLDDIGKYEVPKEIIAIRTFVETKNGKIQREKTLLQIK